MTVSRNEVLADVMRLLDMLSDNWEYDGPVTADTYLLRDLGLQSIDIAILSSSIQEHYQQRLPFPEFFEEIAQRDLKDVTIGEWADFIHANLDALQPLRK